VKEKRNRIEKENKISINKRRRGRELREKDGEEDMNKENEKRNRIEKEKRTGLKEGQEEEDKEKEERKRRKRWTREGEKTRIK
jgi:hypothetical protein